MRKFLIKILKKSIKKNPQFGKDTYFFDRAPSYQADMSYTLQGSKNDWNLPKGFEGMVVSYAMSIENDVFKTRVNARLKVVPDNLVLEKLLKKHKMDAVHIMYNREYEEVKSMMCEPEYLYHYGNQMVQCYDCKAKFHYDDLLDEYGDSPDDWHYTNVCPKCGCPDCCDVEFQKIEDVI